MESKKVAGNLGTKCRTRHGALSALFDDHFLTSNAVAAPRNSVQTVNADLMFAVQAGAEGAVVDPVQRGFHEHQQAALLRFLPEGHLFGLRKIRAVTLVAPEVVVFMPL